MLAYGALDQLSEAVAQRVCFNEGLLPNATILIFDQQSFQNLGAWQSVVGGADVLESAYMTLLTSTQLQAAAVNSPIRIPAMRMLATAAGGTGGGSFLLGGADLGSLITAIAASTSNNASTFTIQDSTMAVSLAHQFERINCPLNLVYYPLFGAYTNLDAATIKVTTALSELNTVRSYVQGTILHDVCAAPAAAGPASCNASTDPRYLVLADLNSQYDVLLKNFLSAPGQGSGGGSQGPGGGGQAASPSGGAGGAQNATSQAATQSPSTSSYSSLLQGAELEDLIKQPTTYILYADVVAAGGTQRDLKNVFTLLTGDWLSYSGGAIVNVALIKSSDTTLKFSDTLRYRTGFHPPDLWDALGFKSFTNPTESKYVGRSNVGSNAYSVCNEETRTKGYADGTHCSAVIEPLQTLAFERNEVVGGTTVAVNVMASGAGPIAGTLTGTPGLVIPNPTLAVPAGSISKVDVSIPAVATQTTASVWNSADSNMNAQIVIDPPSISSLKLGASQIKGAAGANVQATVKLNGIAPSGGAVINLGTSNSGVAAPSAATVTVSAAQDNANFTITTTAIAAGGNPQFVQISASYLGKTINAILVVTP